MCHKCEKKFDCNYYRNTHVMSVVGKSTCSGFKTGLYILSYHGEKTVGYIKKRGYFLKDGRISGYFDTSYMTDLQIEQILHNFEDQKIAFFYLEQVDFCVTLVMYVWLGWRSRKEGRVYILC